MSKFISIIEKFYTSGAWFLLWFFYIFSSNFASENILVISIILLSSIICSLSMLILILKSITDIKKLKRLNNLTEFIFKVAFFLFASYVWWKTFFAIDVYNIALILWGIAILLSIKMNTGK